MAVIRLNLLNLGPAQDALRDRWLSLPRLNSPAIIDCSYYAQAALDRDAQGLCALLATSSSALQVSIRK
jgi:hypothetical protein